MVKLRLFIACCSWWVWVLLTSYALVAGIWAATGATIVRLSNGKTWAVFAGRGRIGLETFDTRNGAAMFTVPRGFSRGAVALAPGPGHAPTPVLEEWMMERVFWREAPKDRTFPGRMRRGIDIAPIMGILTAGVLWGTWRTRGRFRATMAGRCRGCGYDLSGLAAGVPCPECGIARSSTGTLP